MSHDRPWRNLCALRVSVFQLGSHLQSQFLMARPKPLVLVILDGWGYAPASKANAISLARKPNYDKLLAEYPNTLIHTSGHFVGLPDGQMGNSEVGHLTIGGTEPSRWSERHHY